MPPHRNSNAAHSAIETFARGKRLSMDDSTPEDHVEGSRLCRIAADQGLADARYMVGL